MKTSEFRPGDLLIVDDLEGVSDQWKDALFRSAVLIDTFKRQDQRVFVLFLKNVTKTTYVVNVTAGDHVVYAIDFAFNTNKELSACSLHLSFLHMHEKASDVVAFWGVPCLVRVIRNGKEIYRCLTH